MLCIFIISNISAITISPAIIEGNFEPGLETVLDFHVDSNLDRNLEIYVDGDLTEYVELSKSTIYKSGDFKAYIKLPDKIDIPGKKRIYIGAREVIDDEVRGAIAVVAAVQAVVVIHVPYPGKYIETRVFSNSANVGEPIEFGLDITSRGDEQVSVQPRIEIYSESGALLDTLEFQEREMDKGDQLKLEKIWSTEGQNAGNYKAKSIVDYDGGRQSTSEIDFRLGELTIDIINYTKDVEIDGMKPFVIEVESGWNNEIDGAYAEVKIKNRTSTIGDFTTTPTSLTPWQKKEIVGYFNSSKAQKGEYTVNINVYYFGGGEEKTASVSGKVDFDYPKEEEIVNYYFITSILLGTILFILIFFWIFTKIVKVKSGKKKK